jgi:hypothetical protein
MTRARGHPGSTGSFDLATCPSGEAARKSERLELVELMGDLPAGATGWIGDTPRTAPATLAGPRVPLEISFSFLDGASGGVSSGG